ncbi:MAG: phosphatase PAP2 family protein [Spirosomataceae bacterium]
MSYLCLLLGMGAVQLVYSQATIIRAINQWHSESADVFFKYMTELGDGWFACVVIVGLFFYAKPLAGIAGVSFLSSALVAQALKRVFFDEVVRPSKYFEGQWSDYHRVTGVELLSDNSFPSGHTTSAFAVFCLLALVLPNKRWGGFLLIMACLVGYSRMYLFQHFMIDVYAGSVIGTSTAVVVFLYFRRQGRTLNHE